MRENFPAPLLYIGWEDHLMFCAPFCLPLPPDTPFGALSAAVLPGIYGYHPDFAKIDWSPGRVEEERPALDARPGQVAGRERPGAQGRDPLQKPLGSQGSRGSFS